MNGHAEEEQDAGMWSQEIRAKILRGGWCVARLVRLRRGALSGTSFRVKICIQRVDIFQTDVFIAS